MAKKKPLNGTLFNLPALFNVKLTRPQKHILDLVTLLNGAPLVNNTHKATVNTVAMRNCLRLGLIEILSHSPARYRITKIGRAVRTSGLLRGELDRPNTA